MSQTGKNDTPADKKAPLPKGTFTNPIVPHPAADPFMTNYKGTYYFAFTTGNRVEIWSASSITGISTGKKAVIWRAPKEGPMARDIWAPEIHNIRGKWYVYFSATDGPDPNRRQFVLEAVTSDPLGQYREKGKLAPPDSDEYAIDGTVFQAKGGKLYYLWSGREKSSGGAQNIYIAPMSNPWTISGSRVLLSTPSYDWEKHGWWVNEGPEILQRGKKTFVVYSASGGTTPNYALGMLTNTDGNFLNPKSWTKSPVPVFQQYSGPEGNMYTVGHNSFTKSPDGKEDWNIFHAKDTIDHTWGARMACAQKVNWRKDDTPDFGRPIPFGIPIKLPSGDPGK